MPVDRSGPGAGDQIPFAHPEAFTEPEKLLAAYFRSSTVGLCILDFDLRYLAVNSTLATMNGVPAAQHIGKTLREILRIPLPVRAQIKAWIALSASTSCVCSAKPEACSQDRTGLPVASA